MTIVMFLMDQRLNYKQHIKETLNEPRKYTILDATEITEENREEIKRIPQTIGANNENIY